MDRMTYADATTLDDQDLWALRHLVPVPAELQGALGGVIRTLQLRARFDEAQRRAAVAELARFL